MFDQGLLKRHVGIVLVRLVCHYHMILYSVQIQTGSRLRCSCATCYYVGLM